MKRIIYALLMVPLALCVAYGLVNFASDIISGELSLIGWVSDHKVLLVFIVCYLGLGLIGPFKKS